MTDLEFFDSFNCKTMGDVIAAIFKIDNPEDAGQFYRGYVQDIRLNVPPGPGLILDAEKIAQSNIGWTFGEGMSQERIDMWVAATGASHPFFGTKLPTSEEAFKMGVAAGEKMKRLDSDATGEK